MHHCSRTRSLAPSARIQHVALDEELDRVEVAGAGDRVVVGASREDAQDLRVGVGDGVEALHVCCSVGFCGDALGDWCFSFLRMVAAASKRDKGEEEDDSRNDFIAQAGEEEHGDAGDLWEVVFAGPELVAECR